jgi:hypothetical protein
MGTKIRRFSPLPNLSPEELIPQDNFYNRLEKDLDLSFVKDIVRGCYAPPSGILRARRPKRYARVCFGEGRGTSRRAMGTKGQVSNSRRYFETGRSRSRLGSL